MSDSDCDYCGFEGHYLRAVGFTTLVEDGGKEYPKVRLWCGNWTCVPDDEIDLDAAAELTRNLPRGLNR